DHEEDHVGLLDRLLGLPADLAGERPAALGQPSTRIDDSEATPGPLDRQLLAVAGHPGLFLDDGGPLAHEPVDQRRLADVGPADDRDDGIRHCRYPLRAATSAAPSVGTTSTSRGSASTCIPSRKTPRDSTTS